MELLTVVGFLISNTIMLVLIWALCSRLEKTEDKIRSLEEQVDRMEKRKELDAFVEKWAGDEEMDNPDWHKGE